MASINYATKEITVKIVYTGPAYSGKTTNLIRLYERLPDGIKSKMVSLATNADRTIFFDFLPIELGSVKNFTVKFQLYTVPGQSYYSSTRRLVLHGVDGVVFVADSTPEKMQENLESFADLQENLRACGYSPEIMPCVIQYNKREIPDAISIETLQKMVNVRYQPYYEATALTGEGVFDTLKMIAKLVIDELNRKYNRSPRAPSMAPPRPQMSRPVANANTESNEMTTFHCDLKKPEKQLSSSAPANAPFDPVEDFERELPLRNRMMKQ